MDTIYPHCAGLDVHKKTVVACRIFPDAEGNYLQEVRTFATMTGDLLRLSDWLAEVGINQVAMESTGEYWKPVYNLLENNFELWLVNARHIKQVHGRKTDVKDAQWIAQLLQLGLLRKSFVPPLPQRELRDLCRHRSNFIREKATLVNRVHKTLEGMNIKLASVATDVMGVSGRAILAALVEGKADASEMADLARGRMRSKQELLERSLEGRVQAHHRFILSELLCQIDSMDETIERFNEQIEVYCAPFEQAVGHLDTIPGVARATAELIVSEVGTDMTRFATPGHLASWAGVSPGNSESAGKRLSGRTNPGNHALRVGLVQAAHAASRTATYLGAQYRRLVPRRGKKRALLAVAHSILVIAYRLMERGEDYQDLGADYFDRRQPEALARRLTKRLIHLGYEVNLSPSSKVMATA
jgi:transposase